MEISNHPDTLADVNRLYLHISWSKNAVPQPIFRLQISLQIILSCSRAGDTGPIRLKTDGRLVRESNISLHVCNIGLPLMSLEANFIKNVADVLL